MTLAELQRRVHVLSSLRCGRYGRPPEDAVLWWYQIQKVAEAEALEVSWVEWHSAFPKRGIPLPAEPDDAIIPP